MLSAEENERLTRVGGGTPMRELVRRFWLPFLQVSDGAEPDGPPVRVTLLGEQLVAFRDTSSRIGLIDRLCAHRCANLFFGRNEENGLRCTYHGWKYNVRRHAHGGEHFQGILNPTEQSIREETMSALPADMGGAAQISTAMRVLAEIIASDVSLLLRFNHAIDAVT